MLYRERHGQRLTLRVFACFEIIKFHNLNWRSLAVNSRIKLHCEGSEEQELSHDRLAIDIKVHGRASLRKASRKETEDDLIDLPLLLAKAKVIRCLRK